MSHPAGSPAVEQRWGGQVPRKFTDTWVMQRTGGDRRSSCWSQVIGKPRRSEERLARTEVRVGDILGMKMAFHSCDHEPLCNPGTSPFWGNTIGRMCPHFWHRSQPGSRTCPHSWGTSGRVSCVGPVRIPQNTRCPSHRGCHCLELCPPVLPSWPHEWAPTFTLCSFGEGNIHATPYRDPKMPFVSRSE